MDRQLKGWLLLFAAVVAFGGYYWYASRLQCTSSQVQKLTATVIREKILHLVAGNDLSLKNIATLRRLDSGGVACSADVEIKGGDDAPIYRKAEYSAELEGSNVSVVARLQP